MPEIPPITTPVDLSPGGLVSWMLLTLCGIIVALWKMNESKNAKAITDLDARLMASDVRLVVSDAKQAECEKDRHEQAKELAVMKERMNQFEKKFVHGADS